MFCVAVVHQERTEARPQLQDAAACHEVGSAQEKARQVGGCRPQDLAGEIKVSCGAQRGEKGRACRLSQAHGGKRTGKTGTLEAHHKHKN